MSSLELDTAFQQGTALKRAVQRTVEHNGGVFSMHPWDAGAIAQCCANAPGDYLEIGSLFGGSAIVAALFAKGHVYGIDPFGYSPGQTHSDATPSAEVVLQNAYEWGAEDKITMFTQRHPPLPKMLENTLFTVAFIDGDHTYEGVKRDWENLKDRVISYILFHDVVSSAFGARDAFIEAGNEQYWEQIYLSGKMGVLGRVGWDWRKLKSSSSPCF